MSVRIRLRRMGARKQPFYRVVVADSRSPRDGRFLDTIGTYNPRTEPAEIRIDREKALAWLESGAEPTDTARSLLSQVGIWQRFRTGEWPAAGRVEAPPARTDPEAAAPAAPAEEAPAREAPVAPAEEAPAGEAPAEGE
jgi:small subunit ribosomal protein S16